MQALGIVDTRSFGHLIHETKTTLVLSFAKHGEGERGGSHAAGTFNHRRAVETLAAANSSRGGFKQLALRPELIVVRLVKQRLNVL